MRTRYQALDGDSRFFWPVCTGLALLVGAGWWAAHRMDTAGHHITGMSNQVVWGVPHVAAIFLIVAASGALNIASLATVFRRPAYKVHARFSALLAIAALLGGLTILVLDLGRPERLTVAMTHFNFTSVFAWNVFLYTGFLAIVLGYLWLQVETRFERWTTALGSVALVWRLVLTTGTGAIFGLLIARTAYHTAIMPLVFVITSLALGAAVYMLAYAVTARTRMDAAFLQRLARLMAGFVAAGLYLVAVSLLTLAYAEQDLGLLRFLYWSDSLYAQVFWIVQIVMGGAVPLLLITLPRLTPRPAMALLAALLVILGVLAQLYVLVIGGQAWPLEMFPGWQVSSSFFDGIVASYRPSLYELTLAVGGVALSAGIVVAVLRLFPILPAD